MANPLSSRLCLTAVLVMLLAGCAAIEKQETRSTEQLLSAAGFDIKPADTPDKLATLQAMKQNKLVRRQTKDGRLQFLYGAAAVFRCVYVGDEQAYQRYENLEVQQQIAIADQESELDASMDTPLLRRPGLDAEVLALVLRVERLVVGTDEHVLVRTGRIRPPGDAAGGGIERRQPISDAQLAIAVADQHLPFTTRGAMAMVPPLLISPSLVLQSFRPWPCPPQSSGRPGR